MEYKHYLNHIAFTYSDYSCSVFFTVFTVFFTVFNELVYFLRKSSDCSGLNSKLFEQLWNSSLVPYFLLFISIKNVL